MEQEKKEVQELKARVAELEARVAELRHSRRVLMDLLGCQDRVRRIAIQQLTLENRRLRRRRAAAFKVFYCPSPRF